MMAGMAIFLDDQAVELAGGDLGEVLEAAKTHLADSGRMVVDVRIDGEALGGEQIDAQRLRQVDQAEVRLVTADPRELAVETLTGIRRRLGEAEAVQEEAAQLLQSDDAAPAMQKVGQAVEVWLQTQQAVLNSAMLLGMDLDVFAVDGQPLRTFTDKLLGKLEELKGLIEAGDSVGLADALAYEWPAITQDWDRLVAVLVEQIEGK